MRMPGDLHMLTLRVIRAIAHHDPDLRKPEVEALILQACKGAYTAGISEMQEPIKLWEEGPREQEEDHGSS